MIRHAFAYVATLITFLAIDAVWLTMMSQRLYRRYLGDILADSVNPAPAALFYLVYVAGIIFFATAPAFSSGKWTTAALNGALYGFFAYATYDLTNQATVRGWPTIITVADICWGSLLSAAAATLGFLLTRYFLRGA
ncbi:DUF2177 family protein [Mesorhizobium sp. CU2]|uniref:DUF2177 family protein n=1 Tax=unclassified Mesorhizobium TaxID=325217 RepID=UPI001126231F|nr:MULTISPECIES: DUF2177 family protein [unclassified Mesorhizobium]TPN81853.1 DUF2177 family protein [Mesorhizobium sp. CU3]TPO11060.1 DUF2177 family protein [Mesorhizobium sp. CU2]